MPVLKHALPLQKSSGRLDMLAQDHKGYLTQPKSYAPIDRVPETNRCLLKYRPQDGYKERRASGNIEQVRLNTAYCYLLDFDQNTSP